MKKAIKKLILLILIIFLVLIVFPKLGLYSFLFDRGNYNKDYENTEEIISDLNELSPKTKKLAEKFIEACNTEGLYPKITETYRSQKRQDSLYRQGREEDGFVVTWTKSSKHTSRYAFDIAKEGPNPYGDEDFFRRCAEIGRDLGLNPGYFWETQDRPHYQYDPWWRK